jgi:hypothetical protein
VSTWGTDSIACQMSLKLGKVNHEGADYPPPRLP